MKFKPMLEAGKALAKKHAPELLIAVGLSGALTAGVLAVRKTPAAVHTIRRKEEQKGDALTPIETVKATYKLYLAPVGLFVASSACIIGANSINARRNAVLMAAYTASDTALRRYRQVVTDAVTPKKLTEIQDEEGRRSLAEAPPERIDEVIETGKGQTWCFDAWNGRYFKSNIEFVKQRINEINRTMVVEGYVSLNDFYYELILPPVKQGDDLGWNVTNGLIDIHYSSHLKDDNTPCLVMNFRSDPYLNYM